MFDPEAFGRAMGDTIRKAVEPLLTRIERLEEDCRRLRTETDGEYSLVKEQIAAIPQARDGKDCDMAVIQTMVDDAVKALPSPKDGKNADPADIAKMVFEAVSALPKPQDGKSVTVEELRPILDEAIKQLRRDADEAIKEPLKLAEAARDMLLKAVGDLHQPEHGKSVTIDDVAPLIKTEVEKALAQIPTPKDGAGVAGAMIDRDGQLNLTLSNGEVKNLGRIVGKDGEDGISLDAFELDYLDETHEIRLKAACGGRVKEIRYPAGGIHGKGYWREGVKANAGDAWSCDGGLWIARCVTTAKPDSQSTDWFLAARRGRDGERGKKGLDATPPAPIKLQD